MRTLKQKIQSAREQLTAVPATEIGPNVRLELNTNLVAAEARATFAIALGEIDVKHHKHAALAAAASG